jgi:multiple sugar transport system substrate-binding protein
VPYPPSKADQAWTWDQFLANAKKLTKDRAGHDAADPPKRRRNIVNTGTM